MYISVVFKPGKVFNLHISLRTAVCIQYALSIKYLVKQLCPSWPPFAKLVANTGFE